MVRPRFGGSCGGAELLGHLVCTLQRGVAHLANAARHDANTLVLAVNVREPSLRVARYVQATGLTVPVLLDPKGELAKRWGVTVFPTTVLLAPDGQARWRVMGDVDWSGPEAHRWLTEVRQDTRAANATAKPVPLKR
jgi:peroxiredoxin